MGRGPPGGRPETAPRVRAQHPRLGRRRTVRGAGTGADSLHRLHLRARRRRIRLPHHRGRPGRRPDSRGVRLADIPDHDGLLRRHQGHVARQRRRRARLPALRRQPQRLRHGRGRGRTGPGGVRARQGARRAHLLRDRRLRHLRQRLPHDRSDQRGPGDVPGHRQHARPGPPRPHPHRLCQRARLRHPAERPARDRRGQTVPGRTRPPDTDELHQVHGGPLAGRDRRDRGRRLRPRPEAPGGAAHGELRNPRPRVRPGLRAAHRTPAEAQECALRRQRVRRIPVRGAPDRAAGRTR